MVFELIHNFQFQFGERASRSFHWPPRPMDATNLSAVTLEDNCAHCEHNDSSEESQRSKLLQLMLTHVQSADLSSQELDEATLERFLATNSWDPKKASEALVYHLKWWRTYAPLGHIPEDDISTERKKGKLCLQGHDKKGRTIGVFLIVRHDAFDRDLEEFKRYIVYSFEKAVFSTKHRCKELMVIVDLAGWSYKSVDVRGYLALLDILQLYLAQVRVSFLEGKGRELIHQYDHYMNHLGKMILIHVPFIFWAAWKVTSPFFNKFTRERMLFVEDKELQSVLLDEIDEDQLPDTYGGKMSLVPV
ncbi:hypothetical protein GOP47_0023441 [Adiantum capillus-veneris]|uniref:CRAL-TRIO domain-containing protein n=1 Tax=Adiantum capillus-veneris TaxID=13818 RepID=A0A9D4U3H2_ADICA|nr:hypothetical protein GOP47_0023441 [Adiantum capillus-veneris]